jgi:molybdate transport system ATP-binding protein
MRPILGVLKLVLANFGDVAFRVLPMLLRPQSCAFRCEPDFASITENRGTKSLKSNRPFLSLVNATFRLGDRLVFSRTSWVFQSHEHWAIVGANGSGKSLFADALRSRLPLVGGEMNYHFRPMPGLSAEESIGHVSFEKRKSEIHGAVVQSRWNSFEQDGALPVREFLSYDRVMDVTPFEVSRRHSGGRREFQRRLRRAVGLLDLRPFLGRPLLSLSNGEMQRVHLARALSRPTRLLILDEPFIGLDAAMRAHFHAALERLMTHSLRVLLITTRMEDLPRHITHLLCVDSCSVVAAGRRKEILGSRISGRRAPVTISRLKPVTRSARHSRKAVGLNVIVQLRDVTVRYGSSVIVRDLAWTVHAGESWALLGPNGSGKTTLLSLILGDNPQAYSNDVTVFGKRRGEGESIWELKRQIGWVSPELQLHFNDSATCFEAVASGSQDTIGLFEPLSAAQRARTRQCLDQFGLLPLAKRPLFALSAGMQRMVLLARALVKEPALLILDESCQGLDAAHRDMFVESVDALIRQAGVTAIYVTHRRDEIPRSIRRVIRLSRGGATISALRHR